MSTLARGRHLCSNSGAALHESVRAVPRVAFQAGCSLADLASQAGNNQRDEHGGDQAFALPAEPMCITGTPMAGMLTPSTEQYSQQLGRGCRCTELTMVHALSSSQRRSSGCSAAGHRASVPVCVRLFSSKWKRRARLFAGALAHWDVPPLCSGLWRQWGARVVPVEVAAAGGDYRDAFLPRPGRLFRSGVPVPLAALLANLQEHAGSCEAGAAEQAASPAAACGAGGAEELAQRGSGAVGAREGTSAAGGGAGGGGDPAGWVAGGASGAGAARAAGAPSQRLYLAQTDLADALPELGARVPGEPPFR